MSRNSTNVYVRVPEAVVETLDAIVEARKNSLEPTTRTTLIRDVIVDFCREHTPVRSAPTTRGMRRA